MACSSCHASVEEDDGGGSTPNCGHLFCFPCIELKVQNSTLPEAGCSLQCPDGSVCRGYFSFKEIQSIVDEEIFQQFCARLGPMSPLYIDSDPEEEDDSDGSTFAANSVQPLRAISKKLRNASSRSLTEEEKNTPWGQIAEMIKELMGANGCSFAEAADIADKIPVWVTRRETQCVICGEDNVPTGNGVILKDCLHSFCRDCLGNHIRHADTTAEVTCPFVEGDYRCESILKPKELKELSSKEEYEKHYEDLSIKGLESLPNVYNCRTPNCGYKLFVDQDANGASSVKFRCPNCQKTNCTKCKVLHESGCAEYWQKLEDEENERIRIAKELQKREDAEKRDRLNKLEQIRLERLNEAEIQAGLSSGMYEKCPNCSYVCHKYTGCNHVVCSKCKFKFNWSGKA